MKVMGMREFLRGGYRNTKEATVITSHGRPVATWLPAGSKFVRSEVKTGPAVQIEDPDVVVTGPRYFGDF